MESRSCLHALFGFFSFPMILLDTETRRRRIRFDKFGSAPPRIWALFWEKIVKVYDVALFQFVYFRYEVGAELILTRNAAHVAVSVAVQMHPYIISAIPITTGLCPRTQIYSPLL